jgi:hypothetical protein
MLDVPTNTSATVANYAVMNPLDSSSTYSISSGNLNWAITASSSNTLYARATMAVSSGKWYWEITPTDVGGGGNVWIGIQETTYTAFTGAQDNVTSGYAYKSDNGNKAAGSTLSSYGASYTNNDVIGVALDMDAGTLTFYKNNTSQGTAFSSISGTYRPLIVHNVGSVSRTSNGNCNFGQRPFAYTPPTGFVALNTFNLPTPTILQGNKYMDATLYTGNGSTQVIVNQAQFKPDAIWIKTRSAGAYNHHLVDSVRGVTKNLRPNLTGAEDTVTDQVTAINSNGFTLGKDTAGPADSEVNVNGNTYVGWQWQAGQGSTSSNTSGSITSTVSVNTTAGFSIVTYTGNGTYPSTIGHGLGVAPKWIITKTRNAASNWRSYHSVLGAGSFMEGLNNTNAAFSSSTIWNNTSPTSTVFTVGSADVNGNGTTYVAYCWAEIAGFSRFGSYTGNGSADGPFVFTNFRPKFVIVKRTDSTGDWYVIDSSRATYNQIGPGLNPNTSSAEFTLGSPTGGALDFLSNGFKWRGTYVDMNASGGTYIFMAFAEHPFKNSNSR